MNWASQRALKGLALWAILAGQLWGNSISTVLGTGVAGFSGDGGAASEARIRGPFGVIVGPDGSLYVCDTYNHCIRKADKGGIVSTVAGVGGKKRVIPEMGDRPPRPC